MQADVEMVIAIPDAAERSRRASRAIDDLNATVNELSRVRREALEELIQGGKTQAEVGKLLGISRARVGQLLKQGPPPERAFLGVGKLMVVMAGKLEAGRPDPQPVIAAEDLAAFSRLRELAEHLGLGASYESVASGGFVKLNRDNLVVFVGPRHAPNVREVLESDEVLAFDKDERGWFLLDRKSGETYRSGMDNGEASDIAYLARLPRPDGKGTFLYAAGIHALGESGVIHFLEGNLPELYRDVKTKRFSALIECRYDPNSENREIVESRLVTPLYQAGA